jgi:hypothetical protein
MGKVINRGFVTDPNDPVYKRGWRVSISPGFGSLLKKKSKTTKGKKEKLLKNDERSKK